MGGSAERGGVDWGGTGWGGTGCGTVCTGGDGGVCSACIPAMTASRTAVLIVLEMVSVSVLTLLSIDNMLLALRSFMVWTSAIALEWDVCISLICAWRRCISLAVANVLLLLWLCDTAWDSDDDETD